jgi:hypothetical protein
MRLIADYNPFNESHQTAFYQGLSTFLQAAGRTVSRDESNLLSNIIGPEISVTLIGKHQRTQNPFDGMTVTYAAETIEGSMLFVEAIAVNVASGQQGLATDLIGYHLLQAWENNHDGLACKIRRDSFATQNLCLKFDPNFNFSNLCNVWVIPEKQIAILGHTLEPYAQLAKPQNLETIISALDPDKTNINFGRIERKIKQQEKLDLLKLKANFFIVAIESGGIAIASNAFSVIEKMSRTDIRIYLPNAFRQSDVIELIKGASQQIFQRKWRGPAYVELGHNALSFTTVQTEEGERTNTFSRALDQFEVASQDNILSNTLSGKKYIAAVQMALKRYPQLPLSTSGAKRLEGAVAQYGLH